MYKLQLSHSILPLTLTQELNSNPNYNYHTHCYIELIDKDELLNETFTLKDQFKKMMRAPDVKDIYPRIVITIVTRAPCAIPLQQERRRSSVNVQ